MSLTSSSLAGVHAQTGTTGATATITGEVWRDRNGDGVRQPGDAPLAGVEVLIVLPRAAGNAAQPRTDAAGVFTVLVPPGSYQACFMVAGDDSIAAQVTVVGDAQPWANVGGNCSNSFTASAGVPVVIDARYRHADDRTLAITGAPTADLVTLAVVLVGAGTVFARRARHLMQGRATP